jgi:hypothetical protein
MHPSCPFVVKDLNQDGRLDLIFGRGHNYGLYWREQLAPKADGTTQWKQHVIDELWSRARLKLADSTAISRRIDCRQMHLGAQRWRSRRS